MKNKFQKLSLWSFALAFATLAFTYILFHYSTPGGWFTAVWQSFPGKPMITNLFGVLGVLFLFSGIINFLVSKIFFND